MQCHGYIYRSSKDLPRPVYGGVPKQTESVTNTGRKKLKRSNSDVTTRGSVFTSATRQKPSHFTIHPEWASEEQHKN